jgi:hypothetical protein
VDADRAWPPAAWTCVFSMGIYVGNGAALILGGAVTAAAISLGVIRTALLGDVKPWQLVFFVAGLPGLLLAFALLAIREPVRRGAGATERTSIPLREIWQTFLARRTAYITLVGAFALLVMHGHGSGTLIAVCTDFLFRDSQALPHALSLAAVLTLPVAVVLLAVLHRFSAGVPT